MDITSNKNCIGAWHVSSEKSTKAVAIVLKKLGSVKQNMFIIKAHGTCIVIQVAFKKKTLTTR